MFSSSVAQTLGSTDRRRSTLRWSAPGWYGASTSASMLTDLTRRMLMQSRMENSLQVANDRAWVPPGLESRTFYSVALDYFEKPTEITPSINATAYWVRDPGQVNFLLLDKSPEHVSLHRVFRAAAVLATASVFTRPRDKMAAEKCVSRDLICCILCVQGVAVKYSTDMYIRRRRSKHGFVGSSPDALACISSLTNSS